MRVASSFASLLVATAFTFPQSASASLVYNADIRALTAQGFGNAPRDLTLQATGQTAFESGSVGVSSTGAITFGTPISPALIFANNEVNTVAGTDAMPSPLADDQKYGIPTTGSLGSLQPIRLAFYSMRLSLAVIASM